jgi:hypothetical protein
MCKWQRVIPRHKGSPRYRIAHGWKDEFGSWSWSFLKFLMHLENREVHFIFIHTHIFSHTYFFFISFSFSLFIVFSLYTFFYYSHWTLNCIVRTSSPMLKCLLILGKRGDRDKVGTGYIFPLERYLKSSISAPSYDLPRVDDPYANDRLWSRR